MDNTCAEAAGGGHLEILKWARANGCEWDSETCESAARGGHLDVLKWAFANGSGWCLSSILECADDEEMKKWIIENDPGD